MSSREGASDMKKQAAKSAFTLLELIFVIVILGIVASIGSEIIANVYQQYIIQRAQHRASLKTELAALQIANRLRSAIPGTVYRIKNDNSYELIDSSMANSDVYIGLQWVGSDTDSFDANSTPGWSGFCDVDASSKDSIVTRGSNLAMANTIQASLGNTSGKFAIFFPYDTTPYFGIGTADTIALDNNASTIYEHYKLAWSSYALICENTTGDCGDLSLYYNFPPQGIAINTTDSNSSVLLRNVTTFRFTGAGRTLRFKICKEEEIGEDFNITACKEKAVF